MIAAGRIAAYGATCELLTVDDTTVALWRVDDLARYVDRHALLAADDPPEPPYWAHCWTGARLLASAVPRAAGRVVEIGCGLGLPGLVAARRGAHVVFVDRELAPLAFVRESLRTNGLEAANLVVADCTSGSLRGGFDVVLAAEILYDRDAFQAIADALVRLVAPSGVVLLADGHCIDTRAFYDLLAPRGFAWSATDVRAHEEGLPVDVTIVTMRRA